MKTVIITGAFGNLGSAVANKFLMEGYYVIGTMIPSDKTDFNFPAGKFEKVVVDLLNESDSEKFVDGVIAKHGHIDAAILTVGGFALGSVADTKTSDITDQSRLNFETAYNVARPIFIHMMKQNNGRIFFIGSKPGFSAKNGNGMVAYSLAKSMLFRLAELMNQESKGKNVVTNVVVPGTIDTAQNRKNMPASDFETWVTPQAIAGVIFWYCTEEAGALRDSVIKVYNNS
jgi:NAD(P)-dependent dehydrogenase (short-subunit alcohol dehydrogenase family)